MSKENICPVDEVLNIRFIGVTAVVLLFGSLILFIFVYAVLFSFGVRF